MKDGAGLKVSAAVLTEQQSHRLHLLPDRPVGYLSLTQVADGHTQVDWTTPPTLSPKTVLTGAYGEGTLEVVLECTTQMFHLGAEAGGSIEVKGHVDIVND